MTVTDLNLFLSQYARHYLRHLNSCYGVTDVKGLNTRHLYDLDLQQAFVQPSIAPQTAGNVNQGTPIPKELFKDAHTIWDYLRSPSLNRVAIIGAAGSGKTTLLKHITLVLSGPRQVLRQYRAVRRLPILIFLHEHIEAILTSPHYTLNDAILSTASRFTNTKPPSGWFERYLSSGKCLLLFDGLDEVEGEVNRGAVVKWIEGQTALYSDNRFVITSRPQEFANTPVSGVAILNIRPFDSAQIRTFVNSWFLTNAFTNYGVQAKTGGGAENLFRHIQATPTLATLATNPFLLTMIATAYRYRGTLPQSTVELYAEVLEIYLARPQSAKGLSEMLTPEQKRGVLQTLAYAMMLARQREISTQDALNIITEPLRAADPNTTSVEFLAMIKGGSGLLSEREGGLWSFPYLVLQEDLASAYILERGLGSQLAQHINDDWWYDTIRLYCAQADPTPIIEACLVVEPPSAKLLKLAVEIAEEKRILTPDLELKLQKIRDESIEAEDVNLRHEVAEALLAERLSRLPRINEDTWVDNSLISHAEYQLFIDDMLQHGEYRQPDHWTSYQFPQGQGTAPIAGVRPSDAQAFCEWLNTRENEAEWEYRLPKDGETTPDDASSVGYWASSVRPTCVGGHIPVFTVGEVIYRALALDLDRARDRALDLALDHALALDLAHNHDRAHDLDLARAGTRDHAYDLNLALDLAHVRDLAPDRDRVLARARALDLALGLDLALVLARIRDLALDLDLAAALDLDHARARTHTHTRDHDLALDLDNDPDLDLDLERDLVSVLTRALDRDHARARDTDMLWLSEFENVRPAIEYAALILAKLWSSVKPSSKRSGQQKARKSNRPQDNRESESVARTQFYAGEYLYLCAAVAIWGARVNGELPAVEGIRIVKARRQDDLD